MPKFKCDIFSDFQTLWSCVVQLCSLLIGLSRRHNQKIETVMILWLSSQLSQKTKDWKSLQGKGTDVYYSSQGISFNETAFSPRLIFCTQEVATKSPSTFFCKNLQYSSKKGLQKVRIHCLKITRNVAFEFLGFGHFPPIFVLLKMTCLLILFDRQLQVFKIHFRHFQ